MVKSQTRTVRGVRIYKKNSEPMQILKNEADDPEIHGNKVWFSSYFIMDYLEAKPPEKGARIMEIGCGWGLLAIYCAKHFDADVTGVDADPNVFPFLGLHAWDNDVKIRRKVARYENLRKKTLAKQDMIIGADICFWDELTDPLYKLIRKAVDQGVPRIVIADPGRPPFLELAKRCKKDFRAKLREVEIEKPVEKEGYLLVVHS